MNGITFKTAFIYLKKNYFLQSTTTFSIHNKLTNAQHAPPTIYSAELYPRRRHTERTHRTEPSEKYQNREAEHPTALNSKSIDVKTTTTSSNQIDLTECDFHELPIMPPTNSDTRCTRNSYFS